MSDTHASVAGLASTPDPKPTYSDENQFLVGRVADHVFPFLSSAPEDRLKASVMGWNLVAAYAPQTEAEVLHASRIVSLSFTELELLSEANKSDVMPQLRLKYIMAANALNRTICDTEKALARHKRDFQEERRDVERLTHMPETSQALAQIDALAKAAVRQYQEAVDAARAAKESAGGSATNPTPASAPQQTAAPGQPLSRPVAAPVQAERAKTNGAPATSVTGHPLPGRAAPPSAQSPAAPRTQADVAGELRRSIAAAHAAWHQPNGANQAAAAAGTRNPAGAPARREANEPAA
jgi:hypothetical protein